MKKKTLNWFVFSSSTIFWCLVCQTCLRFCSGGSDVVAVAPVNIVLQGTETADPISTSADRKSVLLSCCVRARQIRTPQTYLRLKVCSLLSNNTWFKLNITGLKYYQSWNKDESGFSSRGLHYVQYPPSECTSWPIIKNCKGTKLKQDFKIKSTASFFKFGKIQVVGVKRISV